MDTHELAKDLLENPPRNIVASVDVSTGEHDAFKRVFSENLTEIQYEADGATVSFLFVDGSENGE